jgi:putative transposase
MVQGINLISLVWSDEEAALPCGYRLYNKDQDSSSKNDHFRHFPESATSARLLAPLGGV